MEINTLTGLITTFIDFLHSYYTKSLNEPKIILKYEKQGTKSYLYIANGWGGLVQIRKIILLDINGREQILKIINAEDPLYRLAWNTGAQMEIPVLTILEMKLRQIYISPQEVIVEDAIWRRASLKLNPKEHPCFF